MRLFVALEPPPAVLDEVEAALAPVRPQAPHLRWARREQWHITLAFLGEVADATLEDLAVRLARVAHRHAPLALGFAGAGRFDGRVLWSGVRGDREHLRRLAVATSAAARRAGIGMEDRRFRPHLTLARAREPVDLRPWVEALGSFAGRSWTASELHLVRSRLGPVPAYNTIQIWPLTGRGAAE